MTVMVSGTDQAYALTAMTYCVGGELGCTQQASGVLGTVFFPTKLATTYYIHIQRRSGRDRREQILGYALPDSID